MTSDPFTIQGYTGASNNAQRSKMTGPIHLVLAENPKDPDKIDYYIAIRLDEHDSMVKLVCIEVGENGKDKFTELINKADKSLFKEIILPWSRVFKVESLTYRHK